MADQQEDFKIEKRDYGLRIAADYDKEKSDLQAKKSDL